MALTTRLNRFIISGLFFVLFTAAASVNAAPMVTISTNHGDIVLELYPDKAPKTVANFLQYIDEGFYTNTIFHRVIGNFMIQGGGFTPDYKRKPTRSPIINEATNGLSNDKGTIAMARTPEPNSASAQFFINVADNTFLNHQNKTPRGFGYAVFGKVIKGMDVVEKIRTMKTGAAGPFPTDVPQTPVIIQGMTHNNKSKAATSDKASDIPANKGN